MLVVLGRDAMDDLGRLTGRQPDAAYLELFERHRGAILDGAGRALKAGRLKPDGRLYLEHNDIAASAQAPAETASADAGGPRREREQSPGA